MEKSRCGDGGQGSAFVCLFAQFQCIYDGKRVLIDGSDLFLEYMRKNDYSADLIKKTIAEVTGIRYAIGPYKRKRQEEEGPDRVPKTF